MESAYNIAGIDVHKKMLAVVIANARDSELQFECRRFGTTASELQLLSAWLRERGVQEAAMESTAQYWKPVWVALEGQHRLHLAQARSNRGPRGRKTDFRDAKRIVSRLLSGDPLTRTRYQLREDRVRLQNQLENLLEEVQIKLSSMLSDLLGKSGRRILQALADGESDPGRLADLGHWRLHASKEELRDALTGQLRPLHRQLLSLYLDRLNLIESQMATLEKTIAEALQAHHEAVARLVEIPESELIRRNSLSPRSGRPPRLFHLRPSWRRGWACALEGRKVLANQAAIAPPRGIARCTDYWINSLTPR